MAVPMASSLRPQSRMMRRLRGEVEPIEPNGTTPRQFGPQTRYSPLVPLHHERGPSPLAGGPGGARGVGHARGVPAPPSVACPGGLLRHVARCVRAGREADYGPTRELCEGCPVEQECLEVALADPDLVGLWGNTTEAEQRERWRRAVA